MRLRRAFAGVAAAISASALPVQLSQAAEAALQPGRYGDLLLAIDPDSGVLTGYERADEVGTGTEKAPQFTCRFSLRCQSTGAGQYDVEAWRPGEPASAANASVLGKLKATDTGALIAFKTPKPAHAPGSAGNSAN